MCGIFVWLFPRQQCGMNSTSKKYLRYLRASLSDASRLMPMLDKQGVDISFAEIEQGRLGEHTLKKILALKKNAQKFDANEDQLWPILLTVCLRIFSLRPEHGQRDKNYPERLAPVFICVNVGKDGALYPINSTTKPIIPRNLLEPSKWSVTIGSVEQADSAYALMPNEIDSFTALMKHADDLVQRTTDKNLDDLKIDLYEQLPESYATLYKPDNSTTYALQLVDLALKEGALPSPLFETLITAAQNKPLINLDARLQAAKLHLGQMESKYGLSISQREALHHYLHSNNTINDVLAVDGPPGTGKTTLLLSVIATLWVQRAYDQAEAPLIVAASTNNQAVLNIIEAFGKITTLEDSLSGRWLSTIKSYGLYLPSETKAGKDLNTQIPVHKLSGKKGNESIYDAKQYENLEGLTTAKQEFFENYVKAFGKLKKNDLDQVLQALHHEITRCVNTINHILSQLSILLKRIGADALNPEHIQEQITACQASLSNDCTSASHLRENTQAQLAAIRRLYQEWQHHIDTEPWWYGLFALLRVQGPRQQRDQPFFGRIRLDYEELHITSCPTERASFNDFLGTLSANLSKQEKLAQESLSKANAALETFQAALRTLLPLCPGGITADAVEAALDKNERHRAFKLATHYWEARYLQEVETVLSRGADMDDKKSPQKLERQYRRLAKLFPCFVSTLFTLPNRFIGWHKEDQAMFGTIDLLIIDEAGQVPPEIGAPAFMLAKKALVVGDNDQIAPVWNIPSSIDFGNALKYEVTSNAQTFETFEEAGLAANSGRLMHVAQRATNYTKHPERGRGLFLSEHRRCVRSIIRICNKLVYQDLLEPLRPDSDGKFVPTLAYAHIPGTDQSAGGSRRNYSEATAIAKWIKQRAAQIENLYQSEEKNKLHELVAVVTPFAAQTRAVTAALAQELGKEHKITVGTVHALQGAERRIILFSPTYGLNTQPGNTFIDRDRSMLNVAISRAQDAFLIFGNMHLFQPVGQHPCAVLGQFLFQGGANELIDIPHELLLPTLDTQPTRLINRLDDHRAILAEAFQTARNQLVVISPFITRQALFSDSIPEKIRLACTRNIRVVIVSDPSFNTAKGAEFQECLNLMKDAGAHIKLSKNQGIHSKMVAVDKSWLVIGSFNWLSSVRDANHPLSRYETSLRYDGEESFHMISKTYRDLREITADLT